ncbi:MAG TPA: heptaprenyl diphosphate synthase [Lachnospiraceae bacterium]|nr:heptaprenyl diphosphate synthase [Lachnospiraceae bacterium]
MKRHFDVRLITACGLLLALSMIFSYIEAMLPLIPTIPGIKLGLANGLILIVLFCFGFREAFMIQISRILLCALLFGSLISFVYSLCGGIISLVLMYLLNKTGLFRGIAIGISGGVVHNVVQIIVAYFFIKSGAIFFYLPILIISGIIFGGITGSLSQALYPRVDSIFNRTDPK